MDTAIKPVNITGAALLTQFILMLIMLLGAALMKQATGYSYYQGGGSRFSGTREPGKRETRYYSVRISDNLNKMIWVICISFLISIFLLIFSEEIQATWQPLYYLSWFFRSSVAKFLMFIIDILCVAYLVKLSGGSLSSPFCSVLFLLPGLALFLREPPRFLLIYTILVLLVFTLNMFPAKYYPEGYVNNAAMKIAYWLIAVLCMLLTTYIGYITRPL
jgi:hypothetical protein